MKKKLYTDKYLLRTLIFSDRVRTIHFNLLNCDVTTNRRKNSVQYH